MRERLAILKDASAKNHAKPFALEQTPTELQEGSPIGPSPPGDVSSQDTASAPGLAETDNQVLTLPSPGDIMTMNEAALGSSIEGLVAVISSGAIASGEAVGICMFLRSQAIDEDQMEVVRAVCLMRERLELLHDAHRK